MSGQRGRYPNQRFVSCPCGKRGYGTRKEAKVAARIDLPGVHFGIYECDEAPVWHYGNLPGWVIAGGEGRLNGRVRPAGEV